MTCPSCGEATQPGQRFCAACGQRLGAACAACGAALPDGARFCPECGTAVPLAEAASPASGGAPEPTVERRRVSVLFVDLVGFTDLARRTDAEQVRDLQSVYFERAREIVERYGGTIEKYVGDAVMAVWGAPTANEDDPERAVRAGLDLVGVVPRLEVPDGIPRLAARGGVTTGEAAVTIGADGQGMVSGDTVNLAARLQSVAEPGTVTTDDATRLAGEAAIAFHDAGERELKGFAQPLRVWRADRVVARRGGEGRTGELEPPFVGREAELTLIKELFHASARERRLRVVSVTGQAGIGKSRLAWEFQKYLDGVAANVWWHQGRSPAYGEGITFWALGEMIRRRASVQDGDEPETVGAKVRAMVAEHVPDEEEAARIEAAVGALLGLDQRTPTERGELFGAWRTLFERLSDRWPVVLVFEDLQWADGGLLDFIAHLLEWSRQRPIFVLTLARPELIERFPTWGAGQRNFTSLHLEPLDDAEIRELLTGLVPGLPAGTVRAILARAEGVPLYAVETVRMLLTDGLLVRDGDVFRVEGSIDRLSVPATLQALVTARIDGLQPADRNVLQQASVLGTSFSVEGLAAVSGQPAKALRAALERLAAREVVRVDTDPRSPERGQWSFVQSVIREVAYQTLTKRERKARHLAAARYFESLGDEELAGALARHYLDAWRAAGSEAEAETLAAQARVALRGATDRAFNLHSHAQALAFLQLAMEVTPTEADRNATLERAAEAAWLAAREVESESLLRRALDSYRAAADDVAVARVMRRLGYQDNSLGRHGDAVAILTEGLALLAGHPAEERLVAALQAELARAHFLRGEHETALDLADQAIATSERLDELNVIVDALVTRGSALIDTRPREAHATLYGTIALADRHGLTVESLRARNNLATYLGWDDPPATRALLVECIAITERLGRASDAQWFRCQLAWDTFDAGDLPTARAEMESLDANEDLPDTIRYLVLGGLAMISAVQGDFATARERIARGAVAGAAVTTPEWRAGQTSVRCFVETLAGDAEAAVAIAEAWDREVGATRPDDHFWLGAAYARVGRIAEAERHLVPEFDRDRVLVAGRRHLEAAIAAAASRPDASERFREAISRWRELGRDTAMAYAQLDFATMVGLGDPYARSAAESLAATAAARGWGGFGQRVGALLEAPATTRPDAARSPALAAGEGSLSEPPRFGGP